MIDSTDIYVYSITTIDLNVSGRCTAVKYYCFIVHDCSMMIAAAAVIVITAAACMRSNAAVERSAALGSIRSLPFAPSNAATGR